MARHGGQNIVVVTHGGVLDVIYRRAFDLAPDAPRDYAIPNAGVNWLAIEGERWSVERWGDTGHLHAPLAHRGDEPQGGRACPGRRSVV